MLTGGDQVQAYYERPDVVAAYRSDGALSPSEDRLVERWLTPGSRVLEIGTGGGRGALALARLGFRVTGIDISRPLIDEARASARRQGLDVEFAVADATALPYEADTFEHAVFLCNGLGHFDTGGMGRCLTELIRVTRPGGVVLLSYRTPYAVNRLLPGLLLRLLTRRGATRDDVDVRGVWVHLPSGRRLRRVVRASGLEIVETLGVRAAAAGRPSRRWELYVGGQFYFVCRVP